MNQQILDGGLVSNPELRYTPGGKAVCSFRIGNTEKIGDKEYKNYKDIEVWGKQAEECANRLTKGSMVCVSGREKLDQWDDKDGNKRSKHVLTAFVVTVPIWDSKHVSDAVPVAPTGEEQEAY